MHDDDAKPAWMGARASRCRGYCEGWRDPATYGRSGGFHFQVNVVQPTATTDVQVHGYWAAGGFDPVEQLLLVFPDGRRYPVSVLAFEPPPMPGIDRRPHPRCITVSSPDADVLAGACIRSQSDDADHDRAAVVQTPPVLAQP